MPKCTVSAGLSFLPREKGWVAWGQRTWAHRGLEPGAKGLCFSGVIRQWLVLVTANLRPTVTVGPGVLCPEMEFLSQQHFPKEPGGAVRQRCVRLEAWTPWGW